MADMGQVLVDRYRILRRIGAGGMAAVYRAGDLRLPGRVVAIKEMNLALVPPEEQDLTRAQFAREAQLLAGLSHPGLTAVTDFFERAGYSYLVMDFIPGQTLADHLAQSGRVPPEQVVEWARQLGEVLGYLHSQQPPIIFRDLKPSNIMVTPENRLLLIDFGIARPFQTGKKRDTQNLGTPGYAAPEQYGAAQTDARSDVYSLGVVIHQMLTGYDPTRSAFHQPPPTSLVPGLDPAWDAVIARATALNPRDRYGSAADFCAALPDAPDLASQPTVLMPAPVQAPAANVPVHPPPVQAQVRPLTQAVPLPLAPVPAPQKVSPQTRRRLPVPVLIALVLAVLGGLSLALLARSLGGNPLAGIFGGQTRTPVAIRTPPVTRGTKTDQPLRRSGPTVTIPGCPAIAIDGQPEDWKSVPGLALDQLIVRGNWSGPEDLSALAHLCWSGQNLTLLVQVTDDSHVQQNTGREMLNGDDIELQFDADLPADFTVSRVNEDDYQLGFSAGDFRRLEPEVYRWLPATNEGWLRNVKMAAVPAGQGYQIEAAIPWSDLSAHVAAGMVYGFCLNVHDADGKGGKEGLLACLGDACFRSLADDRQDSFFSNCPKRTWDNPTTWGNLILQ